MSAEFRTTLEKSSTLLKTLTKDSETETKDRFLQFFRPDQEGLSMLMSLLKELSWVKNWMVDGKELP